MKIPSWEVENRFFQQGYQSVIGVDEVGRGPLAGPVVAVALRVRPFDQNRLPNQIRDSKLVTAKNREAIFESIQSNGFVYGVGEVSADNIDRLNILNATKLAMKRAIDAVAEPNSICLIDGCEEIGSLPIPQHAIPKADEDCVSVAAASIVAKVIRDRQMLKLAQEFPGYQFESNVGYGTQHHFDALDRLGPCLIHRRSFLGRFLGRREKGIQGEESATRFLKQSGYKIIDRNVRLPGGEIDIVALRNGAVRFVEVRSGVWSHEELAVSVGPSKQKRLRRLAEAYLCRQGNGWSDRIIGFDVITVAKNEVRLFENGFGVES